MTSCDDYITPRFFINSKDQAVLLEFSHCANCLMLTTSERITPNFPRLILNACMILEFYQSTFFFGVAFDFWVHTS